MTYTKVDPHGVGLFKDTNFLSPKKLALKMVKQEKEIRVNLKWHIDPSVKNINLYILILMQITCHDQNEMNTKAMFTAKVRPKEISKAISQVRYFFFLVVNLWVDMAREEIMCTHENKQSFHKKLLIKSHDIVIITLTYGVILCLSSLWSPPLLDM